MGTLIFVAIAVMCADVFLGKEFQDNLKRIEE